MSHILAAKVRYGDERLIVGMVVHENNGKYYYDHELIEIKKSGISPPSGHYRGERKFHSVINVSQNQLFSTGFDKKSKNLEFSNKRLHNQINPAVRDGVVRQEFADLLEKKEYTPETIAQWDKQAMEWILKQGGVYPAGQALLNDKAPVKDAVAELVRRHILNSDVFATAFDLQERIKLNEQHIDLQDWKRGRIIEQDVSIDDLWWNGDDINEWGYDDGKNYADANIPNNRKLLDVITYDDNGNIIPLSQRRSGKNVWLCVFPAEFRSSKISR